MCSVYFCRRKCDFSLHSFLRQFVVSILCSRGQWCIKVSIRSVVPTDHLWCLLHCHCVTVVLSLTYTIDMSTFLELIDLGRSLGMEGLPLTGFAKDQQKIQRAERVAH